MDLKTIRQNVFRFLATQSNIAKLDDCIGLIIAEILGFINSNNAMDYEKWRLICLEINNYKNLCKKGLLEKIKIEFLDNKSTREKQVLIENKVIYEIQEDNIIFTPEFIVIARSQKSNLRTDYGNNDYNPLQNGSLNKDEKKLIHKVKDNTKKDYFSIQEETELNRLWADIETEERKSLFPFWKWKITTEEYKNLEIRLTSILYKIKKEEVIERHAFKLALYYSEWYKRVYNGNDSEINMVFKDIEAKDIWGKFKEKFKEKHLYKINQSFRWDDSLKLLGGLPLTYITSENKNSNLSLKFSKLFRDINSDKTLNLEDLGLNNQSMNKSAQKGGSIYEFINKLLDGEFPFAESDMKLSPFKEFKSFVNGGLKEYKEEKKKKFSVNWLVEQHSTFEHIYPYLQIKLKQGEDYESHRFISKDRLLKWGIENSITHFEIIVRLNFQKDHKDFCGYYFNLCANGKFISRSGEIWKICLWDLPEKPLSIEFILKTKGIEKSIQEKSEIPNYIQLWNAEFGLWHSRMINGKPSAVLFLNDYTVTKESFQTIEIFTKNKINKYRWSSIVRELVIIDNGKERTLYQKDGCLEVTPKNTKPFSNAILYDAEGKVKYIEEESEKKVYLLKGEVEFEVRYITKSMFRNKNIIEEKTTDEYFVKYKTSSMLDYSDYLTNSKLEQGFIKFRISSGPYKEIIDCYWLNDKALINRDVYLRRIVFTGIDEIDLPYNQYLDNDINLDDNCILVKIGNENAYVELDIFRALNRKNDLIIEGKYKTTINLIPVKFADNFTVRAIDSNGLQLYKLSEKIDKYKKLRVIYNNNNLQTDSTGIDNAPNLPGLQTYTKEIQNYKGFYYFPDGNNKSLNEYEKDKFYFLSLKTNKTESINFTVEEINNTKHIGFRLKKETDGIVFQSLNTDIFQDTYRPFFVSTSDNKFHADVKKDDRARRISRYKEEFDYTLAITHFNLAIEHSLYFGMFDILWALEDNPTLLANFYLKYYSSMKDSEINFKELHRFAEEMLFDWMLIPRKLWLEVIGQQNIKEKQEWTLSLFRQKEVSNGSEKYALIQCCEKYWTSKYINKNQDNLFYLNIKRIKKVGEFFNFASQTKLNVLKEIDQSNNIYASLLETLNE